MMSKRLICILFCTALLGGSLGAGAAPPDPNVQKPKLKSSSLLLYVVPFPGWCRNHAGETLEGRVWAGFKWNAAPGTRVPAYLKVDTGAGVFQQSVWVAAGENNLSTASFRMPAREVCTDSCVNFRLVAKNSADVARINTGPHKACVR